MNAIPLSLYVHVPWCVRKCPYCDFNSHAAPTALPEAEYVDALLKDLALDSRYAQGRQLQTIFIGGGTPSLFSAQSYERLLRGIDQLVPFAADIEITLEANPGTFEQQKFHDYRSAGIDRLSIGIQSFDDAHLQRLGRIHGRDEALRAAAIARQAGFDNFNLDLMFGLPEQSEAQALADLRTAIDCGPSHLSWYQLTIEPNTEFYRRPPTLPPDDAIADLQQHGIELMAQHGFQRYEISAYGQPGNQARHNLNYWRFGDYLGIGAGAHGKLTEPGDDGALNIRRTRKTRMPAHYLAAVAYTAESNTVPAAELPLEFMMNAMRLCEGVEASLLTERTGLSSTAIAAALRRLQHQGLMQKSANRLEPTPLGLLHLNALLLEFM
ncbi:MAG TPA: radical SAM family heme chaperone HemW [Candidatus Acidoferrum sp.]|nr:radical SAM family heme chaperone HemW [Candidatus Acidoferrum sp.]